MNVSPVNTTDLNGLLGGFDGLNTAISSDSAALANQGNTIEQQIQNDIKNSMESENTRVENEIKDELRHNA